MALPQYVLSPAAERDIESILAWTHEQWGESMRLRYEALLVRAILDIVEKPQRGGSHSRQDLGENVRTYHLAHSRARVKGIGRVKRPRHFLLYRLQGGQVEIGRVLHDTTDSRRHLPEDYRAGESE